MDSYQDSITEGFKQPKDHSIIFQILYDISLLTDAIFLITTKYYILT